MAADRMAEGGSRTCEILAFHSAGGYQTEGTGCPRQTALDHRTELRGTQAGTRTRALRGPRLARVPPPRHALHSSLRPALLAELKLRPDVVNGFLVHVSRCRLRRRGY